MFFHKAFEIIENFNWVEHFAVAITVGTILIVTEIVNNKIKRCIASLAIIAAPDCHVFNEITIFTFRFHINLFQKALDWDKWLVYKFSLTLNLTKKFWLIQKEVFKVDLEKVLRLIAKNYFLR